MAELDTLVVRLEARTGPFRRELQAAANHTELSGRRMRGAFDQVGAAIAELGKGLGALRSTTAALKTAVDVVNEQRQANQAAAKAQRDFNDALAEAERRTGQQRPQAGLAADQATRAFAGRLRSMQGAVSRVAAIMGSRLEDVVLGTKTLREAFRGLERDLIRLLFRLTVLKPLQDAIGKGFGRGPLAGGFGTGSSGHGTTSLSGSLFAGADLFRGIDVPFAHEGGVVSDLGLPKRAVSPLAFLEAPRLHDGGIVGLRPDLSKLRLGPRERPVILEQGETVLRRGQSPIGAVNININLPPGADARGFRESAAFVARRAADEIDRRAKFR